jgi:hypothetical protein
MGFFIHCDSQLAYCPITYIVALAFCDNAFENDRLTPELIWRITVLKRLHVLPLRWKKTKLKTPLLRGAEQTLYDVDVHPSFLMKYDSSNATLKGLGEGAGFRNPVVH